MPQLNDNDFWARKGRYNVVHFLLNAETCRGLDRRSFLRLPSSANQESDNSKFPYLLHPRSRLRMENGGINRYMSKNGCDCYFLKLNIKFKYNGVSRSIVIRI